MAMVGYARVSSVGQSVALALGCMFKETYISAGQTYSWLGQSGSHPLVDPLWGNESNRIAATALAAVGF